MVSSYHNENFLKTMVPFLGSRPTPTILEKAQDNFKTHGKVVSLIKPLYSGDDFNDVLKKQGIKEVQEYVKSYLDPDKGMDISQKLVHKDTNEGKQIVTEWEFTKTLASEKSYFDNQLPTKQKDTEKFTSPHPTPLASSSTKKSTSIDLISDYLNSKIKEMKAFEGTSLGEDAKKELWNYVKTLQKNETLFNTLQEHYKDCAKELERLSKEKEQIYVKDRSRDLGI